MRGTLVASCLVIFVGCSHEPPPLELVPVAGVVKWKGVPLKRAVVTFIPDGSTRGGSAFGRTDASGAYRLLNVRGKEGVAEGDFKVTISKRLMPDGSEVPENDTTPPIDSPAREIIPAEYSDLTSTRLTAKVVKDGMPLDFDVPLER